MTTFQDPPPQSRRAVRQSERGEPSEPQAPFPSTTDMWDTTARRAAQLPPAIPRQDAPASATGRRAAPAASAPPATAEPLSYSTQARPAASAAPAPPAPEAPTFRTRGASPAPGPTEAGLTDQSYRVRDFSPEGRRSAAPVAPPASEERSGVWPTADLDYHTEARLHYEVPVAPPQPAPTDFVLPSAPGIPVEQTLTRRELRALQEAEQAAATGYAAPAAFTPAPTAPAAFTPAPTAPPTAFPLAPEPLANTGLTNALSEFDALAQGAGSQTGVWTPPVGHWSVQAGLDDGEPYENTINRTVGSGTATTSALVLPAIPPGSDIRGPLTGTGEIMLTGSIDLPHSFSSTGATARFDHEGIDALFDAGDAEVISTDSAPVRAVTAVSTHNSGQGVTHTQKPKGTRALTALLIAASSMAVVVAGLLIVAFALNVF